MSSSSAPASGAAEVICRLWLGNLVVVVVVFFFLSGILESFVSHIYVTFRSAKKEKVHHLNDLICLSCIVVELMTPLSAGSGHCVYWRRRSLVIQQLFSNPHLD